MLRAAQRLFERDGYAATSMTAVAELAGVAPRTLYLAFESKSGMLRALWHLLLRGDSGDAPVGQREWFRAVIDERDPERKLRLNMSNSRAVKVRAGALLDVIRSAAPASPEIAVLWSRIQSEFYENQRAVVQSLDDVGALRPGLDVAGATDILWSINHPSFYSLLASERGWSPERYERWAGDLLCAQLLA